MKKRGKRALIITNRIELLSETGGTLQQFDLHPFEILAGQMKEPPLDRQVYIAMSQTLRRRVDKWPAFFKMFDVVIYDECHLQEFNGYAGVFDCIVLGFTATPIRSGKQRQLADDFTALVTGPDVPELIRDGYLVRDKYYGVTGVDMAGVRISSLGDFQESEMFGRFNKKKLYSGVVENWKRYAFEIKTLVFCVNIIHCVRTCEAFNRAGIRAKFITSDLSPKSKDYDEYINVARQWSGDRDEVIGSWKRGEYQVLINAGILTTGFNARDIQCIVMNRATVSLPLWLQILGRGSRTYPGKDHFIVLDFGDNLSRLGGYNQQREWSLTHDYRKSAGAPPVKECKGKPDSEKREGCGALIYASQTICPFCGYEFQIEKADPVEVTLVPVEYTAEPFWKPIEREAEQRGYKHGWVINRIIYARGMDGIREYAAGKGYNNGWLWRVKQTYAKQLASGR